MDDNPERIYINLSSSSADTLVTTSVDPEARFYETRTRDILADVSKYRMCIVRAALQGNRNFPILQASIQTGQPLPFKTTYVLNMQITAGEIPGIVQPTLPFPQNTRMAVILKTYDSSNMLQTINNRTVFSAVPITPAGVAAQLTAQFALLPDPLGAGMVVSAVGDLLEFTVPLPVPAVTGWWYSIQAWRAVDATSFGFASMAVLESEVNGTRSITLPYPCSYGLPIIETDPVLGGVFTSEQTLMWEPQVSGLYVPKPPLTEVDTQSEAYWLYDYAWFSYLLNKTLTAAFDDIATTALAAGIPLATECPRVTYVPERNAFSLRMSYGTTSTTATGGVQISITLNKSLSNLMAWPGRFLRDGTSTLLFDSAKPTADGTYIDLLPDYAATGSGWSPVGSLVFLCSRWMIRPEIMSAPNKVGFNTPTNSNPSSATQQILSDVVPSFSDASDWNAFPILYSPQVLRWIDMPAGASPLRDIDFTCAWRNAVTGVIRPVTLNPGASFSVKILLQRRDILD